MVRKPHICQVLQVNGFRGWKTTCVMVSESVVTVVVKKYVFFWAFETTLLVVSVSGCVVLKLDILRLFQPTVSVV